MSSPLPHPGLVTSLQKDITSKEQTIQQLKVDAEKLRQESREKDSQLAHISAQVNNHFSSSSSSPHPLLCLGWILRRLTGV